MIHYGTQTWVRNDLYQKPINYWVQTLDRNRDHDDDWYINILNLVKQNTMRRKFNVDGISRKIK